jgi:translation initiation factor 6
MAHVDSIDIKGEVNIGLMIYANDKFALVPRITDEKTIKIITDILQVPCYKVSIAGTPLVGVFLNGTSKKILVPEIIFDKELKELEAIGKEHGVEFLKFESELTCLGNNMLISDEKALLNPDYTEEEVKRVEKLLGVKAQTTMIAEIEIVGAAAIINYDKKKALVHREASDKDIKLIEKTFEVEVETGSINMGSPYIKSGIVCNKNGFLAGLESGGPEINNADQALGFIEF